MCQPWRCYTKKKNEIKIGAVEKMEKNTHRILSNSMLLLSKAILSSLLITNDISYILAQ